MRIETSEARVGNERWLNALWVENGQKGGEPVETELNIKFEIV
jgi:hypothetical protein